MSAQTTQLRDRLETAQNPLDVAEQLFLDREWLCDRPLEEELVAELAGGYCNYRVWMAYEQDLGGVIFSCAFDMKVPEKNRSKLYPLLAQVNERMWLGHFDMGSDDGMVMFRHAILTRGREITAEQFEDMIDIALAECNRFYPAFQSVLWGGTTVEQALEVALLETVGEA